MSAQLSKLECTLSKWSKVPFNPANCAAVSPGKKMKTFSEGFFQNQNSWKLPMNGLFNETKIKKKQVKFIIVKFCRISESIKTR